MSCFLCCLSSRSSSPQQHQQQHQQRQPLTSDVFVPVIPSSDLEFVINVNDVVVVNNLTSNSDLNGRIGVGLGFIPSQKNQSIRWKVQLSNGETVSVLPKNLFVNSPRIQVGDLITITGLRAKPTLNGKQGRCIKFVPASETTGSDGGRWAVRLLSSTTEVAIKSNNLFRSASGSDSLKTMTIARCNNFVPQTVSSSVHTAGFLEDSPPPIAKRDRTIN